MILQGEQKHKPQQGMDVEVKNVSKKWVGVWDLEQWRSQFSSSPRYNSGVIALHLIYCITLTLFTEKTLNEKLHFLCSVNATTQKAPIPLLFAAYILRDNTKFYEKIPPIFHLSASCSSWEFHLFRRATKGEGGRGETFPALFWKLKKVPWFWGKKALIVSIFGLNIPSKM